MLQNCLAINPDSPLFIQLDQMSQESHNALSELQSQLEEYKERSRREITDSQKHAKDRNAEVEKMQYNLGRLQDEVRERDCVVLFLSSVARLVFHPQNAE